jgi:hypothetical protein
MRQPIRDLRSTIYDLRLLIGVFLILVFGFSGVALAHGGGTPQLANAKIGPYRISVWTEPAPLRVGEAHFSIAVAEPPASDAAQYESGPPVLGATVELQLQPVAGTGQILTAQATHETAVNKLFYEADIDLPAEGLWEVTISVAGADGSGSVSFEIEVLPSSNSGWMVFGGIGLAVLVTAWGIQWYRKKAN